MSCACLMSFNDVYGLRMVYACVMFFLLNCCLLLLGAEQGTVGTVETHLLLRFKFTKL